MENTIMHIYISMVHPHLKQRTVLIAPSQNGYAVELAKIQRTTKIIVVYYQLYGTASIQRE